MIRFASGLDVKLGNKISKHVLNISKYDKVILESRQDIRPYQCNRISLLSRFQCECSIEMKWNMSTTEMSDGCVLFQGSDVHIDHTYDRLMIDIMGDMVQCQPKCILSAYIRTSKAEIKLDKLLASLNLCSNLVSLYFYSHRQNTELFGNILPKLKQLRSISFQGSCIEEDITVVNAIPKLSKLQYVHLSVIGDVEYMLGGLGGHVFNLNLSHMSDIRTVYLHFVWWSDYDMHTFVKSLINLRHKVDVTLKATGTVRNSTEDLLKSPHFEVHEKAGALLRFSTSPKRRNMLPIIA